MIVKQKIFNYFMIELLICGILVLGCKFISDKVSVEKFIGFFTIINIIIFFITQRIIRKEVFSISTLFTVFMYLFNLGLPVSRLFGWIDREKEAFVVRRIYIMGKDTFIQYSIYAFLLITMLQLGIFYYYSKQNYSDLLEYDNELIYEKLLKRCNNIGVICLILGIIPYIYEEYIYIQGAVLYGYSNSENTSNLSGTGIGLIGNLFVLGIFFLIYSYQKNKIKFNILFYFFVIYQIIRMYVTGDRSTGVTLILVCVLIRHKFVSEIKGIKAVLYLFIVYIAMIFIKLIEMTRFINSASANDVIYELFQSNMFAETIFEYGGNVWSGMMVYYSVPSTGSFRYGLTYIAAIIGKPLSILGINDSIWRFADFSYFINDDGRGSVIETARSAMGGSFSGEWYFNFGWIGLFFIPVFGYFLAKFSDACVDKKQNPVLSAFFIYIATLIIWWVRQYFTSVSWYSVFYGLIVYFLYKFLDSCNIRSNR